jgi:cephalosporin hydroxylase
MVARTTFYKLDKSRNGALLMKITFDLDNHLIVQESNETSASIPMYSREGFELVSKLWAKMGWNEKYIYTFSWMGRPIIQLPEDMVRTQEVIYLLKPDVIIETGVAHGGSLIFYASLCKAIGKGRIIGVDIEIRPHNRKAIEKHELYPFITLIEGNSVADEVVNKVKSLVSKDETVLIILDSNHTKQHVLKELESYHDLVSPGSYIVATDGIMKEVYDTPRGTAGWESDNPTLAAMEFVEKHPGFIVEKPEFVFNESKLEEGVTHWPGAWLKRIK